VEICVSAHHLGAFPATFSKPHALPSDGRFTGAILQDYIAPAFITYHKYKLMIRLLQGPIFPMQ
jgi:hypothetical protein